MSNTPIFRSVRLLPKTAEDLAKFAGNRGEVFYDSTSQSLRVYDSETKGGFALLKSDLSNISGGGSTANNVNFGTRTVQSAGFIGTISDISNHDLEELANVDVGTAANGQVLYFDGASSTWKATTLTSSFNGGTVTSPIIINNSTASTSTTTGALRVSGGAGIGGALHVGTTITAATSIEVTAGPVMIRANNLLRLYDTDNTNFVGLKSPANLTEDVTYILPGTDGTSGQVLQTNGLGVLSWATVSGGGGGGTSNPPGGTTSSIQYNNNGAFGGSTTFTYDLEDDLVSITDLSITDNIDGQDSATITGIDSITLAAGTTINEFSTDGTLNSESDNKVPTELAVKTYVDTAVSLKANVDNPTFTGTVSANAVTVAQNIIANNNVVINKAPTATNHATNKRYVDVRAVAMSIALS